MRVPRPRTSTRGMSEPESVSLDSSISRPPDFMRANLTLYLPFDDRTTTKTDGPNPSRSRWYCSAAQSTIRTEHTTNLSAFGNPSSLRIRCAISVHRAQQGSLSGLEPSVRMWSFSSLNLRLPCICWYFTIFPRACRRLLAFTEETSAATSVKTMVPSL